MFNPWFLNELLCSLWCHIKIQILILILLYAHIYMIWASTSLTLWWLSYGLWCVLKKNMYHIDGLVQDCGSFSALALELLQCLIGPSMCGCICIYVCKRIWRFLCIQSLGGFYIYYCICVISPSLSSFYVLIETCWGRVTHIWFSNPDIHWTLDNGLVLIRYQANIWPNVSFLSIEHLRTNFGEILIQTQTNIFAHENARANNFVSK